MKSFYKRGFTEEGILWRKGDAEVIKPKKAGRNWKVRISGGKEGQPLEKGEGDFILEKDAFRAGRKLAKQLKKLKKSKP
jgi:hypothetical protein